MQTLTPVGQNIVDDISHRYNLSPDSTVHMLVAINNGGGTMAQFSIPELGSGQWMRGGMIMVGDMFNHGLKNTVNNLCCELSDALANNQIFPPAPQGQSGGANWWPGDFGSPSSSGSQNNIRYAFFPSARRLAVERDGVVTVFDTQDHNISGVSQQQGGNTSLTFSSQYGTISTLSLPLVSGPGLEEENQSPPPAPAPTNFADAPPVQDQPQPQQQVSEPASNGSDQSSDEIMDLLAKLGQLRDSGVLTDDEFNAKKADLLGRL